MDPEFVNLTPENLADEHLSCIIRVRKPHPGVEAKRQWLADRLREGHVFRKLQVKDPVFIEYAPLETAWVPVLGDNYLYVSASGRTVPARAKATGARSWSTAWPTRECKASRACACWGRRSRRRG